MINEKKLIEVGGTIKSKKKRKSIKYILLIVFLLSLLIGWNVIKKKELEDKSYFANNKLGYTENSVFPELVDDISVHTDLIDFGSSRPGTKRLIKYIVIHETDNYVKGVGAANHAHYLKNNNTSSTSWHYTVDDHEIYHHIPDNEIAYHAGEKTGNEYGIGIELCVNRDGDFNKTFDNAAKLTAYLLKSYNLDIEAIKMHHDFSGKDCPSSIIKNNRFSEFKDKVQNYLKVNR